MKEFVKSITSPYEKELIETRRYLHRHPELSFQETDTAAYIRSTLNALGIPLMEGISGTSTVAVIKGEKTGPCIAFRADIDALPVCPVNVRRDRGQGEHTVRIIKRVRGQPLMDTVCESVTVQIDQSIGIHRKFLLKIYFEFIVTEPFRRFRQFCLRISPFKIIG